MKMLIKTKIYLFVNYEMKMVILLDYRIYYIIYTKLVNKNIL